MFPEGEFSLPHEDLKMMDDAQTKANKDMGSLLPCDPCMCAFDDGIDQAEEVEMDDIGLGLDDEFYDL